MGSPHLHLHHLAKLRDGHTENIDTLLRCDDVARTQRANAVIGLRVVGAEHELGEVLAHPSTLCQRVVEREEVRLLDRTAKPDEFRDLHSEAL